MSKLIRYLYFYNFKIFILLLMSEGHPGFEAVWRKGALHIIYLTGTNATIRFRDLKDQLTISDPTISTRLDELEEAGLLRRTFFDEMPPRVEYSLTPAGEELYDLLIPLFEWAAEQHKEENVEAVAYLKSLEYG